jgi:hypothetical protein
VTGSFHLSLLPVGIYKVEVAKARFESLSLSDVVVAVGADPRLFDGGHLIIKFGLRVGF